jgi:hypothetical protein
VAATDTRGMQCNLLYIDADAGAPHAAKAVVVKAAKCMEHIHCETGKYRKTDYRRIRNKRR